jgi:hypothetical protein
LYRCPLICAYYLQLSLVEQAERARSRIPDPIADAKASGDAKLVTSAVSAAMSLRQKQQQQIAVSWLLSDDMKRMTQLAFRWIIGYRELLSQQQLVS